MSEIEEKPIKTVLIYKIYCPDDDDSLVFIGYTTRSLREAFSGHKYSFKEWLICKSGCDYTSSSKIFDEYGIDNVRIKLLQEFKFKDKDDVKKYVNKWIVKLKAVNTIKHLNKKFYNI